MKGNHARGSRSRQLLLVSDETTTMEQQKCKVYIRSYSLVGLLGALCASSLQAGDLNHTTDVWTGE
jgi:hypothetical protein